MELTREEQELLAQIKAKSHEKAPEPTRDETPPRSKRRKVLVRTENSTRLLQGSEKCIGSSRKPCTRCQVRAGTKYEVSYASIEGYGSSTDRFCMSCRSEMVMAWDTEKYREFGDPPGPKGPRKPSYQWEDTPGKWHPEPDFAEIADKETPGWR